MRLCVLFYKSPTPPATPSRHRVRRGKVVQMLKFSLGALVGAAQPQRGHLPRLSKEPPPPLMLQQKPRLNSIIIIDCLLLRQQQQQRQQPNRTRCICDWNLFAMRKREEEGEGSRQVSTIRAFANIYALVITSRENEGRRGRGVWCSLHVHKQALSPAVNIQYPRMHLATLAGWPAGAWMSVGRH